MPPPINPRIPRGLGQFTNWISSRINEAEARRQVPVYDRGLPGAQWLPMELDPAVGLSFQGLTANRMIPKDSPELAEVKNLRGYTHDQGYFDMPPDVLEWAMSFPPGPQQTAALAFGNLLSPFEQTAIPAVGLGLLQGPARILSGPVTAAARQVPLIGKALQFVPKVGGAFLRPPVRGAAGLPAEAGLAFAANAGAIEGVRRVPEDAPAYQKAAAGLAGGLISTGSVVGGYRAGKAVPQVKSSAEVLIKTKKALEAWDETYNESAWKNATSSTQRYKDTFTQLREADKAAKDAGYEGPVIDTSQVDSWKRPAPKGTTVETEMRYTDLEERGYAIPKGAESTGRWQTFPGREQALRVAGGADLYPYDESRNLFGTYQRMPRVNFDALPDAEGITRQVSKVYHGSRSDAEQFIDDDGNLHLRASSNYEGRQVGISLTDMEEEASWYATRGGMPGVDTHEWGSIVEIDTDALAHSHIVLETGTELFFPAKSVDEELVIPAGMFKVTPVKEGIREKTVAEYAAMSDKELIDEDHKQLMLMEQAEYEMGAGIPRDMRVTGRESSEVERIRRDEIVKRLTGDEDESLHLIAIAREGDNVSHLKGGYKNSLYSVEKELLDLKAFHTKFPDIASRGWRKKPRPVAGGLDGEDLEPDGKVSRKRPEEKDTSPKDIDELNSIDSGGLAFDEAGDVGKAADTTPAEDPDVAITGKERIQLHREQDRIKEPTEYSKYLGDDEKAFFTKSVLTLDDLARRLNLENDEEIAGYLDSMMVRLDQPFGREATWGEGLELDLSLAEYLKELNISLDPLAVRTGWNKIEPGHIAHIRNNQIEEIKTAIEKGPTSFEGYAQRFPLTEFTVVDIAIQRVRDQLTRAKLNAADADGAMSDPWIQEDLSADVQKSLAGIPLKSIDEDLPETDLIAAMREHLTWIPTHLQNESGIQQALTTRYGSAISALQARLQGFITKWNEEFSHLPDDFYKQETMMPLFEALDPNTFDNVTAARASLDNFPEHQKMYDIMRYLYDPHEESMLKFMKEGSEQDDFLMRQLRPDRISRQFIHTPNYGSRLWVRKSQPGVIVDWADLTVSEKRYWQKARNNKTFREMVEESTLQPFSWHPLSMAMRRIESGETLMLNLWLLNHAKNLRIAKNEVEVKHLVDAKKWRVPALRGPNVWRGIGLTEDDVRETAIEDTPFKGYKPTPVRDSDGLWATNANIAVPNYFADVLELMNGRKGVFERGQSLGKIPGFGTAFTVYNEYANTMKRNVLTGSLFQHSDMIRRAVWYGALAPETIWRQKGGSLIPFNSWTGGHYSLMGRMLHDALSKESRAKRLVDLWESDTPFKSSQRGLSPQMLLKWGNLNIAGDESLITKGMYDLVQDSERWIYKKYGYIPRQLMKLRDGFEAGLFQSFYRHSSLFIIENLLIPVAESQHPDWTLEQLAMHVAEQANVMTSQLQPMQTLIPNPAFQAGVRRILFSYYENESLIRTDLRALPAKPAVPSQLDPWLEDNVKQRKGIPLPWKDEKGNKRRLTLIRNENFRAFSNAKVGTLIGMFLASNIINWAAEFFHSETEPGERFWDKVGAIPQKLAEEAAYWDSAGGKGKRHGKFLHDNEYPDQSGGMWASLYPYKPLVKTGRGPAYAMGYELNRYFMAPINPFARGIHGEPIYWDMWGQMDTMARWALNAPAAMMSRLDVIPSAGFRLFGGSTFQSGKTRRPVESAGQFATDVSVPIAARPPLETLGRDWIPGLSGAMAPGYDVIGPAAAMFRTITGENLRAQTSNALTEEILKAEYVPGFREGKTPEQLQALDDALRLRKIDNKLKDEDKWFMLSNDDIEVAYNFWTNMDRTLTKEERDAKLQIKIDKGIFGGIFGEGEWTTFITKGRQPDRWRTDRLVEVVFKDQRDYLNNFDVDTGLMTRGNYKRKRKELYGWAVAVSGKAMPAESEPRYIKLGEKINEPKISPARYRTQGRNLSPEIQRSLDKEFAITD